MKSPKALVKISLRLNQEDLETLREFYKHAGYNKIVRALVARAASRLRERFNAQFSSAGGTEVLSEKNLEG